MGNKKVPAEGGSGGKRGHSNMEHGLYTEEIKTGARKRRRRDDKAAGLEHGDAAPVCLRIEREADGRWIAEVPELPGVIAYGASRDEARRAAVALAVRVIADRLEHGEPVPSAVLEAFTV